MPKLKLKFIIGLGVLSLVIASASFASTQIIIETNLRAVSTSYLRSTYKGPFKHPYQISAEAIQTVLHSIHYSNNQIIWSEGRPLFTNNIINKIAEPLSQQLKQSKRYQVINFKIKYESLRIEGETFVNGYGLHWKIKSVQSRSKGFRDSKAWDNSWKLVPQEGQHHWQSKDLLGSWVRELKWIFIPHKNLDSQLSLAEKRKIELGNTESHQFYETQFLEDLRNLKTLYKFGRLNRKQYYKNLDALITSSGWEELPFRDQGKLFQVINNENLLPERKRE
jgi:hypothetical protein